jgi:hypothetical protein
MHGFAPKLLNLCNLRNLRIFHLWDLGSSFLLPLQPGKRTLPDV